MVLTFFGASHLGFKPATALMEHTPVKEDEVELSQIVHSDRALLAHTRHTNQGYGNKGSKGAKGGSESPKKVAFAREANVSSRLPSEIEKKSILRYLKKDVSKTQLYKSLPIYLLVLLLISISLLLQRKDDPTGYWANAYAKDVLLLSSDQFHKVDSEKTFWTWLERVALTEESGLGISIPSDEYVFQVTSFSALIQFRGLMSECSDNAELHAISPHRKYAAPAYCLSEYSDSDANTSAYGPLLKDGSPLFKANCDLERPLDGLVLNGMQHFNEYSLSILHPYPHSQSRDVRRCVEQLHNTSPQRTSGGTSVT